MDAELDGAVARFAGALGPDGDMRVGDWALDLSGLSDAARVAAQGLVDAGQHMAARAVTMWALANGRTRVAKKRASDDLDELLADIGADEPDAKRAHPELDLDIGEMLNELDAEAGGAADDGGYNSPAPPHTFPDCSVYTSEKFALQLLARDLNTGTQFRLNVHATEKYAASGAIKYQVELGGKSHGWFKAKLKTEVCFGQLTEFIEANAGKHPVGRIYAFHIVGSAIPPPFE
jgi:hypothetical protein